MLAAAPGLPWNTPVLPELRQGVAVSAEYEVHDHLSAVACAALPGKQGGQS